MTGNSSINNINAILHHDCALWLKLSDKSESHEGRQLELKEVGWNPEVYVVWIPDSEAVV